jgi:hypothetical protein
MQSKTSVSRWNFALVLLTGLFFFLGCGTTASLDANPSFQGGPGPAPGLVATALGKVTDTAGTNLVGVNITVGGNTLKTDANGNVSIAVPANQNTVITAQFPNFATGYAVVSPPPGATQNFQVALKAVRVVTGLNPLVAQTVTDNRPDGRNGSVRLQPNSVVNAKGEVVNPFTVEIATVLPSDPLFGNTFPGLFAGISTGGALGPIASFGFVDVTLRDSFGNRVNLNPNLPAELTLPIDPANDPGTPTIEFWTLDENRGIWVQVGVATRDTTVVPNVYRASVTHFTPYNLDRPFVGGALQVLTVLASDGTTVVPNVQVKIESFDPATGTWSETRFTSASGTANFSVPRGFLRFTATKDNLRGFAEFTQGAASPVRILMGTGGHFDQPMTPTGSPSPST